MPYIDSSFELTRVNFSYDATSRRFKWIEYGLRSENEGLSIDGLTDEWLTPVIARVYGHRLRKSQGEAIISGNSTGKMLNYVPWLAITTYVSPRVTVDIRECQQKTPFTEVVISQWDKNTKRIEKLYRELICHNISITDAKRVCDRLEIIFLQMKSTADKLLTAVQVASRLTRNG